MREFSLEGIPSECRNNREAERLHVYRYVINVSLDAESDPPSALT